jgi:hypothetical protein
MTICPLCAHVLPFKALLYAAQADTVLPWLLQGFGTQVKVSCLLPFAPRPRWRDVCLRVPIITLKCSAVRRAKMAPKFAGIRNISKARKSPLLTVKLHPTLTLTFDLPRLLGNSVMKILMTPPHRLPPLMKLKIFTGQMTGNCNCIYNRCCPCRFTDALGRLLSHL